MNGIGWNYVGCVTNKKSKSTDHLVYDLDIGNVEAICDCLPLIVVSKISNKQKDKFIKDVSFWMKLIYIGN